MSAAVPFVRGGAELLEEGLVRALLDRDVEVVHVRIPFRWDTPDAVRGCMAAAAGFVLPEVDVAVPLKFPAWLIPHPDRRPWIFHQYRQMYDLWELGLGAPDQTQLDWLDLKAEVTWSDTRSLSSCTRRYTFSPTTAERLNRYNGLDAGLLYSPLPEGPSFRSGDYGDYVVMLGRVNGSKRQHLAVEAMAHTRSSVRLVVAGVAEPPEYGDLVRDRIDQLGLHGRVEFLERFISDHEKISLLAGALASCYIPIDEDNFGFVTAESFLAERPVVTMSDSGGVRWLVEDDRSGFVAEPTATSLASTFDRLHADRRRSGELGRAGAEMLAELGLDWERVVEALLA